MLLAAVAAVPLVGASAEAGVPLQIAHSGFELNGRAVVPLLGWEQCAATLSQDRAIGINMLTDCADPEGLDRALLGTGVYQLPSIHRADLGVLPSVAGFFQDDEPDNAGELPVGLPDPSVANGKPVFLNTTAHFAAEMSDVSPAITHDSYPAYWAKADVLGFDLYPLAEFCGSQWVFYADVYTFQRELNVLGRGKPTFQWIELNQLDMRCGSNPQTPQEVVNEAWLAFAGGASALGYFTWGPAGDGTWTPWLVQAAIASALAQASARFQELAPVLESPQIPWSQVMARDSSPVKVGVRTMGGRLWLIAVNSSDGRVQAAFGVRGAGTGSASVWQEGRSVPLRRGSVADRFAPYQTHVYLLDSKATNPTRAR